jgi:hypothetical protein
MTWATLLASAQVPHPGPFLQARRAGRGSRRTRRGWRGGCRTCRPRLGARRRARPRYRRMGDLDVPGRNVLAPCRRGGHRRRGRAAPRGTGRRAVAGAAATSSKHQHPADQQGGYRDDAPHERHTMTERQQLEPAPEATCQGDGAQARRVHMSPVHGAQRSERSTVPYPLCGRTDRHEGPRDGGSPGRSTDHHPEIRSASGQDHVTGRSSSPSGWLVTRPSRRPRRRRSAEAGWRSGHGRSPAPREHPAAGPCRHPPIRRRWDRRSRSR